MMIEETGTQQLERVFKEMGIKADLPEVPECENFSSGDPRHTLQTLFRWEDTKQGHEFWSKINLKLGGFDYDEIKVEVE